MGIEQKLLYIAGKITPLSVKNTKLVLYLVDKWIDYRQPNIENLFLKFTDTNMLIKYMKDKKIQYSDVIDEKSHENYRKKYYTVFDTLKINLLNSSFIDLGPGLGDSLDVAKDLGAKTIEFADFNNYNVVYMRLNGYKGYKLNYIRDNGITKLYPRKYDVVLSRGSINADIFNRNGYDITFPMWLNQLENIVTQNGNVIICPAFELGKSGKHICENPELFLKSLVAKTLLDNGYKIMFIENFNEPKNNFPFTFYKKFF